MKESEMKKNVENEKSKKSKKSKKQQQQTNSELLEQYFNSTMENQLLRSQNKHTLKIGNIVLEVLPTSKDDLGAVFKHFTKFAKEMKKLHNDAHLLCCESGEVSSSIMDQMIG